MKTKADGTLGSKIFTESLLGFESPDEWLQIANGFNINATNDEFYNVKWAFDKFLKTCDEQMAKADERLTVVNDRLEELGIADKKVTWIKDNYQREFKTIAEKLSYSFEAMQELVNDSKRMRRELEENEKEYIISTKMANDYLCRLCKLNDKIEG